MKRPCSVHPCPNEATYRGRCAEHNRKKERETNRKGKPVYNTKRWKHLRRKKLSLNPLCEYVDPDEGPCVFVATDVHHRHGVVENPWEITGLESLCHGHHSHITRLEQLEGEATP